EPPPSPAPERRGRSATHYRTYVQFVRGSKPGSGRPSERGESGSASPAVAPASTGSTTPVIHRAASLARKAAAAATSQAVPSVWRSERSRRASRSSGVIPRDATIGVYAL